MRVEDLIADVAERAAVKWEAHTTRNGLGWHEGMTWGEAVDEALEEMGYSDCEELAEQLWKLGTEA